MASRYGHQPSSVSGNLSRAVNLRSTLEHDENLLEKWRECRRESILVVSKLRQRLDDTHFGANIAKVTGAGIGLFGEILKPSEDELRTARRNGIERSSSAGSFLEALGTIIAVGAEVVEKGVTFMAMEEAKSTLEKDQKHSQSLQTALHLTKSLESATKDIFNCDIFSITMENIMKVFGCALEIMNKSGRISSSSVLKMINYLNYSEEAQILEEMDDEISMSLQGIMIDPYRFESMKKVYNTWRRSPIAMQISKRGIQNLLNGSGLQSFGASNALGEGFHNGMLKAANVASEVVGMLSIVDDLKEDRKTVYSEYLRDVEHKLTQELYDLSNM